MSSKYSTQALVDFLSAHVPMAANLGLQPVSFDHEQLTLEAPLTPNINDKGTAFGGSIYCVAVMSCWGMVYLRANEYGLKAPDIVVSHGEIDYLKPVAGAIVASCYASEERFAVFWADYQQKGRAKIALESEVKSADGEVLARFSGRYALLS